MAKYDGTLCLNCPIEICDDQHPACLYRLFIKASKADRTEYFKRRYRENREAMLEAAKQRQKDAQAWKQRDRTDYFKARYRAKCDAGRLSATKGHGDATPSRGL